MTQYQVTATFDGAIGACYFGPFTLRELAELCAANLGGLDGIRGVFIVAQTEGGTPPGPVEPPTPPPGG